MHHSLRLPRPRQLITLLIMLVVISLGVDRCENWISHTSIAPQTQIHTVSAVVNHPKSGFYPGYPFIPANFTNVYITDNYDNNDIVGLGGGASLRLQPTSNGADLWNQIDCAQKYAQRGGWETYCLFQDQANTADCWDQAGGYVYDDPCGSGNSFYFWRDGGWFVSLSRSQGNYAGTNGVMQAVTVSGTEFVQIVQVPPTTAARVNQWTIH